MNARRLAENVKQADGSKAVLRDLVDRTVENRCSMCGHLLFLGKLGEGSIVEIKCPRCGQLPCMGRPYGQSEQP